MDKNTQIAINRRKATLKKLNSLGIDHCEGLPLIGDYRLYKSKTQICKRFIASLFFSLLACDYMKSRNFYETDGKKVTERAVETFELKNYLFPKEKKVLEECDERTAINVSWTIECCYSLAWVLGLISTEEMELPCEPDGPHNLFQFIQPFQNFEDFKASCKLRQPSEIMDILDLYYNYHWACVDNRLNPETNCGELNEEVVMERRKALEWLICRDKDWDNISLDT
jgi:hypothetical protein